MKIIDALICFSFFGLACSSPRPIERVGAGASSGAGGSGGSAPCEGGETACTAPVIGLPMGQTMPGRCALGGPAPVCCTGCIDSSEVCQDGYSLDVCGTAGTTCSACATGETCTSGACAVYASTCLAKLEADGALGAACSNDAACGMGSWCQDACCDSVTHVCTAIRECRAKFSAGEPCDHVGGDHECASGTCDTITNTCL